MAVVVMGVALVACGGGRVTGTVVAPFATVSAGRLHTCGVTTAGAAYCWGSNFHHQLGDSGKVVGSSTPVAVVGGLVFGAISTGGLHTCGLTTSGAAYCWGFNAYGQLGDGSTNPSSLPVRVVQ